MFEIMLEEMGFGNFIRETIDACYELAKKKDGDWKNCADNLHDFIGNMPSED